MANYWKYKIQHYPIYIYILYDNIKKHPIYVGATKNLKTRLIGHKSTRLKNYINKDFVTIELLEETTSKYAEKRERYWYNKISKENPDLIQKSYNTRGNLLSHFMPAIAILNYKGKVIKKHTFIRSI